MNNYRHASFQVSLGPPLSRGVKQLIILCTVVFLVQAVFLKFFKVPLEYFFGIVPYFIAKKYWAWQFFTYLFLHGNLTHLIFNMFVLWMFGSELENLWGKKQFFVYYMICGVGAGVFYFITSIIFSVIFGQSLENFWAMPTVGASGAIYGLLMAYALYFGERMLLFMFIFPLKAKHFILIIGAIELIMSVFYADNGVAHLAHLGGMLFGYLFIRYQRRKKYGQTKPFDYEKEKRREAMKGKFKIIVNENYDDDKGGSDPSKYN